MPAYDAIVIGAGHNGLVCAARLARAGRRVLVLERRDRAGGLCGLDEFHPGFSAPGPLQDTSGFSPRVASELGLQQHGLAWAAHRPVRVLRPDGSEFGMAGRDLVTEDARDIEALAAWRKFVAGVAPLLRDFAGRVPPKLHPQNAAELRGLLRPALRLRLLGKRRMVELLRVAPMAAADWLREYFPDESLAEALLGPVLLGTFAGPGSAGSAFHLLLRESLRGREIDGGTPALNEALLAACTAAGVEIRLGQAVEEICTHQRRATGVRSADGVTEAAVVVAACDPKTAMLELVDPAQLDVRVDRQFRNLRTRGTAAILNLAMRGAPDFERALFTTGGLDQLERAFDAVKYGEYSAKPFLEASSFTGARFAPADQHVVSVRIAYCCEEPTGSHRNRLGERVLERINDRLPGFRDRVIARELLTPADIERRYGNHGGQIAHLEPALDQIGSMRPSISSARYATPVDGLYLASGGCHPIGGISGLPGLLAAEVIRGARS
ncbi:MAG: NAD(P)/FAD-dependent oxidoreductase [Gammaproteobacteria bacterium]|nr:NAD(P)/FAD-dependent oxidoreductase [Gammaproteobacteria bacterium]